MAENGKTMANNKEKTLIMIKPDGVQRGLVGKIIQRYEEKGFKLVAIKMVWVSVFQQKTIHYINFEMIENCRGTNHIHRYLIFIMKILFIII